MRYSYTTTYHPAFPSLPIILRNNEAELSSEEATALLDTGSDGSIVPIEQLRAILAPVVTEARIRSHWGEWRTVQLFAVDVQVGLITISGLFVVGDDEGNEIILGRDFLNKLRVVLDGLSQFTELK